MAVNRQLSHRLWVGLLAGPVAFLLSLQANYMLVDLACEAGQRRILHAVPIVSLIMTLSGGVMAWHACHELERREAREGFAAMARSRFMAFAGMANSGFFALALLAQWLPIFLLSPCQR